MAEHTYSDGKNVYDVHKLWQLAKKLPAQLVPVEEFLEHLYQECWDDLCPIDAEQDPYHWDRVEKADLLYPILLTPKYDIMDGMHRLVKAARSGAKNIMAKIVPIAIAKKALIPESLARH